MPIKIIRKYFDPSPPTIKIIISTVCKIIVSLYAFLPMVRQDGDFCALTQLIING